VFQNGKALCGECYADNPDPNATPREAPQEETPSARGKGKRMPKILDERTRTAIQADLVAGEMNINKIAEKHGVGWMTVKNLQKGAGGGQRPQSAHVCKSREPYRPRRKTTRQWVGDRAHGRDRRRTMAGLYACAEGASDSFDFHRKGDLTR
jgi:hypothetical protein